MLVVQFKGFMDNMITSDPPSQCILRTFLDSVLVPPIGEGAGEAETLLFLDGNHSQVNIDGHQRSIITELDFKLQVSVVTKIVPSPDWFVGLSSVELCHNGDFIKSHVEEVCTFLPQFQMTMS